MTRRALLWSLAAAAVVLLVGLAVLMVAPGGPSSSASGVNPGIGGPFRLIDQRGQAVNQSVLKGKWSAIFFGYTYCPDVCPTTLQTLGAASNQLGQKAKAFQVVFVTVDPQRDTPKQLNDYLTSAAYSKSVIGLTGSEDEIAVVTKAYGVYSQKQGTGADYTVNHSSAIYLMNPKGQFDSVIPYGLGPEQVRDRVLKAMRENAAAG